MRRLPLVDRILLLTLVPLWAVCFFLAAQTALRGDRISHVTLLSLESADAYPVVAGLRPYAAPDPDVRAGDRLLSLGDLDLRGMGPVSFQVEVLAGTPGGQPVPVRFERDGEIREGVLPTGPFSYVNLPLLPVSLSCALVAVIAALRARPSPMVRWGFCALMCIGIFGAAHFGGTRAVALTSFGISSTSLTVAPVTVLYALMRFPAGEGPGTLWERAFPWLLLPVGVIFSSTIYGLPFPIRPEIGYPLVNATIAAFFGACLWVVTSHYRRADPIGRRQLKWFLFGFYLAALPMVATALLSVLDMRFIDWARFSMAAGSVIPLMLLISINRYNLLDIDRLMSATATYNVVIAVVVGLGIALVPKLAAAGSSALGIEATSSQIVFSLALAAVVVPLERRLRPQLERFFFRERHAVDAGITALLRELPEAEDAMALTSRVADRLDALLRPEACVVYAQNEEESGYAPVYAAGAAVPMAFADDSTLVTALRELRRGEALAAAGEDLAPFDRAALETLGAEVVLPIHSGEQLFAFLCLGPRRSGDVYTPTDVRLLEAVTEKASNELQRFEQEALLREAQEKQDSLRRYVPGAVAEELDAGGDLTSAEREVTVLFVDIRGYTAFSEPRAAEEIFSTVNRYTETVSEIVRRHGGSIVEFSGDGMMTVFGAPRALADKERAALMAAREIAAAVPGITPDGAAPLHVGVGVATGEAFVGNVRSSDRLIWTAIGNTTNLAARLQSLTRDLDASIVIDATTHAAAGSTAADFEIHRGVRIRGRSEPVVVQRWRASRSRARRAIPPSAPDRQRPKPGLAAGSAREGSALQRGHHSCTTAAKTSW